MNVAANHPQPVRSTTIGHEVDTSPVRATPHRPMLQGALRRYRDLPGWLLLAQLFLAAGWLRAAASNAAAGEWWVGGEVRSFVAEHVDSTLWFYRPLTEHLVLPAAPVIAVIVLTAQVAVGVALAANYRTVGALLVGMALNVNFMLAGSVNPSIFYLVLSGAILLWRLEHKASAATRRKVVRRAVATALIAVAVTAPGVSTVDPDRAIEDPALVLVFAAALGAGAIWWAARNDPR